MGTEPDIPHGIYILIRYTPHLPHIPTHCNDTFGWVSSLVFLSSVCVCVCFSVLVFAVFAKIHWLLLNTRFPFFPTSTTPTCIGTLLRCVCMQYM